jgi:hypothetical protein
LIIILLTIIRGLGVGKRNEQEQRYFDEFYEEVFTELDTKYGPVDELVVCENIGIFYIFIIQVLSKLNLGEHMVWRAYMTINYLFYILFRSETYI